MKFEEPYGIGCPAEATRSVGHLEQEPMEALGPRGAESVALP